MAERYVQGNPERAPTVLLETLDFRAFDKERAVPVHGARRSARRGALEPVLQLLGAARVP